MLRRIKCNFRTLNFDQRTKERRTGIFALEWDFAEWRIVYFVYLGRLGQMQVKYNLSISAQVYASDVSAA